MYPDDKNAQKAHLIQHGQTSLLGLGYAFGVFGAILTIIVVQFVPLIAHQKEQETIYDSHRTARAVQQRVALIYEKTNKCPVGMPVSTDNQKVSLDVVGSLPYVKTDCAVVATVSGARYPVRYLNGRNLTLYHTTDGDGKSVWRCQTSLNKKQSPKRCT